jgi:phage tail sheath protein FI
VRVAVSTGYQVNAEYVPATLLSVEQNALSMCAARGDLFAVLDLPWSYREDDAISMVTSLKAAGDEATFSYGGVYHPWPIGRDDNDSNWFRTIPPSGAACGVIASLANTRGAWIAPANTLITGVVDLDPGIARERWLDLQQAQINIVRREARGFLSMSADTLSDEDDLRPINVRRLMMLLRRLAFQRGARYVFEPNSYAFQRLVAKGFDAVLRDLFRRGAFAGATAESSYQVVTDSSVNTSQSMDDGRFIVELKVAPALPLTFMTVRLLETGNQKLFVEAR